MSGNGYGTALTRRQDDMAAYDRSPAWLRQEMQQAVASWSAKHLLKDVEDLSRSFDARTLRGFVRKMMLTSEAEDAFRFYGPAHPEADNHGKSLKPAPNAVNWSARRRK